jgi:uncharacterized membrane protein
VTANDPDGDASARAILDRLAELREHQAWRRSELTRRSLAAALLALDLTVLGAVLASVHGHPRQLAGLAFCLFVPGCSIVGLLRLRDVVLELALSMAVGLAALVIVAQIVITAHVWHLFAIEVGVTLSCLPSLAWQAVRPPPRPSPAP